MKHLLKFKLFENPDAIKIMDPDYHYFKTVANWDDPDAYPFGIVDGKMYVGDPSGTHHEYTREILLKKRIEQGNSNTDLPNSRMQNKYAGRIWINKKYITFWKYPKSNKELKKIINDIAFALYKKYNIKMNIWNDPEFKIEVNVSPEYTATHADDDKYMGPWAKYTEDSIKLIPLKDYTTSLDVSNDLIKQGHIPKNADYREEYRKYKIKKHGIPKHKHTKDVGTEPYLKHKYALKTENKKYKK